MKYTAFITLPVALCLIALSEAVTSVMYGGGYPLAAAFIKCYLLIFMFEGIGGLSLGNLVIGVGETRVALAANLLTVLVGAPLSLTLIPQHGIWGLITALVVAPRAGVVFMLWWVKKSLGFSVDWRSSLRLYSAGSTAFLLTSGALMILGDIGWMAILIGGGLFFAVYIVAVPVIGALRMSDIKDLAAISDVSGPLRHPLRTVLMIMAKLARN